MKRLTAPQEKRDAALKVMSKFKISQRRIGLMLEREGVTKNYKKLRRLYAEEDLAVKQRRGRKRATGLRAPIETLMRPNERWSLDFLSDVFEPGRRFRILAVIDGYTREFLGLIADTSIFGIRVAHELDKLMKLYGQPATIFFRRQWQ